MATTQYVALLRGVNVGGNNIIKMADLKACLEAKGFENVGTYIQSGNVFFEGHESSHAKLSKKVNDALLEAFKYEAPIVVHSHKGLKAIVLQAPRDFGAQSTKYRYDVIFLKEPLTAAEAIKSIKLKEDVDAVAKGPGVLYFSRLIARITQSQINRIVGLPVYKSMTIRNWNTTSKLLALMDDRAKNLP